MNWIERDSGLIVPKEYKNIWPTAIDLFCGAGGFSCGYISAGFEVVAGLDWDCYAAITYMTNLGNYPIDIHFIEEKDGARLERAINKCTEKEGEMISSFPTSGSGWISHQSKGTPGVSHFFLGDVKKITGEEILKALKLEKGEVDCVCGGPPCQGFSIAGKRRIMDPQNSYVFDFVRLIIEIQPKTMLFENVPGIMSMVTPEGLPVLDAMCKILEDGGWGNYKTLRIKISVGFPEKTTAYKLLIMTMKLVRAGFDQDELEIHISSFCDEERIEKIKGMTTRILIDELQGRKNARQ